MLRSLRLSALLLGQRRSVVTRWLGTGLRLHSPSPLDTRDKFVLPPGFTRLCASKDGEPDGLEKYIPSVFVNQLSTEVCDDSTPTPTPTPTPHPHPRTSPSP